MVLSVMKGDMPYGAEGTDYNFAKVARIAAEDVAMPSTCRMRRPSRIEPGPGSLAFVAHPEPAVLAFPELEMLLLGGQQVAQFLEAVQPGIELRAALVQVLPQGAQVGEIVFPEMSSITRAMNLIGGVLPAVRSWAALAALPASASS